MKSYDNIITIGCSFLHGSNINRADGSFAGPDYRLSKLLAEHYKAKELNPSEPGSGNERILNSVYEYYLKTKNSKNLFVIGISGLTRELFFTNNNNTFYDMHAHDFSSHDENRAYKIIERLFNNEVDKEWFDKWRYVNLKYLFNEKIVKDKLHRDLVYLDAFFKYKNIDYVLFNSIDDSLDGVKEDINFFSFNIKNGKQYNKTNETGDLESATADSWYHYLRLKHEKVCENFNDNSYRSGFPPYGKWFCGGHPSPNANRDLADKLIKYIDRL